MINNRKRFIIVVLIVLLVLSSATVAYATATKDAHVCQMHTDSDSKTYWDCDEFEDMIDDQSYSWTTYLGQYCFGSYFEWDHKTVKYWSAHGDNDGDMWGYNTGFNGPSSLNLDGTSSDWETSYVTRTDWDDDLEFVFIGACYQLDSNVRYLYARSMLGTYRIRVISGYHDSAPGYSCDYKVVQTFETYADASNSVKYSWLQANEYWYSQGYSSPYNYCILTHDGSVQYSRMPGFGGTQYTRPGTDDATILRFSHVNQSGTTQPTSKTSSSTYNTSLEKAGFIVNCDIDSSKLAIPTYTLESSEITFDVDKNCKDYNTMTAIKCDSNEAIYTMHEVTDKAIGCSDKDAVSYCKTWINDVYGSKATDYTENLYEVLPLVVAEVDLDGNVKDEAETTFAYTVRFANMYDDIRILDNFNTMIIDKDGVASSMLRWNDFVEKTSAVKASALTFDEIVLVLAKNIDKTPAHLRENFDTAITVDSVEVVLSNKLTDSKEYKPTWLFYMSDGTRALIDCFDGTIKVER